MCSEDHRFDSTMEKFSSELALPTGGLEMVRPPRGRDGYDPSGEYNTD